LSFTASDKNLLGAVEAYKQIILDETLADELIADRGLKYETVCKVEGASLTISLEKA
jgi:hypothetical protein